MVERPVEVGCDDAGHETEALTYRFGGGSGDQGGPGAQGGDRAPGTPRSPGGQGTKGRQ